MFNPKVWVVILTIALMGAMVALYLQFTRYSTSRPAVRFDNGEVTKKEYLDTLEYQSGKPVLTKLVLAKVVLAAAKKQNVLPTDADVDTRISEIERRNPALLNDAQRDPTKMMQLKQDLKTDLALEKLRSKDVKVTDAEVTEFYNRNKAAFALPMQKQTLMVVTANPTDADQAATLLKQNIKPDVIAKQPRLHVVGINGFSPNFQAMRREDSQKLTDAITQAKVGDVVSVQLPTQPQPTYIVTKIKGILPGGIQPLDKVKEQVVRVLKEQKAPSPAVMLKKVFDDAHVVFEVDKYRPYFDDLIKAELATAPKATAKK